MCAMMSISQRCTSSLAAPAGRCRSFWRKARRRSCGFASGRVVGADAGADRHAALDHGTVFRLGLPRRLPRGRSAVGHRQRRTGAAGEIADRPVDRGAVAAFLRLRVRAVGRAGRGQKSIQPRHLDGRPGSPCGHCSIGDIITGVRVGRMPGGYRGRSAHLGPRRKRMRATTSLPPSRIVRSPTRVAGAVAIEHGSAARGEDRPAGSGPPGIRHALIATAHRGRRGDHRFDGEGLGSKVRGLGIGARAATVRRLCFPSRSGWLRTLPALTARSGVIGSASISRSTSLGSRPPSLMISARERRRALTASVSALAFFNSSSAGQPVKSQRAA